MSESILPTLHRTRNANAVQTYGLLYNLFGDSELNLGLVPQSVYDMQSAFYPSVFSSNGVPLDTRHTYTKIDWEILCASIASQQTAQQFYSVIANWINTTSTNLPLEDLYDTISGQGFSFHARPVVGSLFGPLALKSAPRENFFHNRKGVSDLISPTTGSARKICSVGIVLQFVAMSIVTLTLQLA